MQRGRTITAIVFSAWLFSHNIVIAQISEDAAIKYAKNVSVAKLDSNLTAKPLAQWLREIIGKDATMQWELNDCGEQTGNPVVDRERDMPACVGLDVDLMDGRKVSMTIIIGTHKKGVFGSPEIYYISIESNKGSHSVKRLGELEKTLHYPSGKNNH
ncbi:MAG: hypothetical protein HY089_09175 [Ignavibacteriales bacterium]|nr:hypothetical protein [Ignavibacteriales bacterium]